MKTAETVALEKAIRRATYKMGTFGCYEVTIGYGGKERVDYMTYDTKGIFRCYEVKVSKADFHSAAVKSFVGHYNYYVLTRELYDQVKGEIPDWVGVYMAITAPRKPRNRIYPIGNIKHAVQSMGAVQRYLRRGWKCSKKA